MGAPLASHYLWVASGSSVVAAGTAAGQQRYGVPLAVAVLAPVDRHILAFHTPLWPRSGFHPALMGAVLWVVIFHRRAKPSFDEMVPVAHAFHGVILNRLQDVIPPQEF